MPTYAACASVFASPLDKPLIPKTHGQMLDFDAVIDADDFMDSGSEFYADAQPALHAVH